MNDVLARIHARVVAALTDAELSDAALAAAVLAPPVARDAPPVDVPADFAGEPGDAPGALVDPDRPGHLQLVCPRRVQELYRYRPITDIARALGLLGAAA